MYDIMPKLTIRDLLRYAIAYMFWLISALIALGAIFMVRAALNAFWPAMHLNRWVLRPLDRFGLVFMGLLWLVYVIFCEQHFRSSITMVRLRRPGQGMRSSLQAGEGASGGKLMRTLKRLGLDVLAKRLVPTLLIPLAILGLAYLVYSVSWIIMRR